LVNIKKSYSPQKGEEKPACGKVPPRSDIENEPPRVIIIPGETTAPEKENESLSNIENVPPVEVDLTGVGKENDQNYEGHKNLRKPNTYVKIFVSAGKLIFIDVKYMYDVTKWVFFHWSTIFFIFFGLYLF